MILQAKSAGADFVKFQSYNSDCLKKKDPEYRWFKKVSLSNQDHVDLKKFSEKNRINFLAHHSALKELNFYVKNSNSKI